MIGEGQTTDRISHTPNFFHFNNQQSSLDNHQSDVKNAVRWLRCDHQQVSNDHDACSSTRKISVITQQATEALRLQLRPQCKLQKSCGRAQELVIHRELARKGAECELDVACSQRAEDGSRCRDALRERPIAHAPRDGQDPGVVRRSVDRSASVRRCESSASKSVAIRPIRP